MSKLSFTSVKIRNSLKNTTNHFNYMSDLFIITSVINTGDIGWKYSPKRSLFNSDERFQQTINTIDSIRQYSNGGKILLVEGSILDDYKLNHLKSLCDYVYYVGEDLETKNNCILSNCKGLGDSWMIGKGLEYIKNNNLIANNIYKMSGRYRLNNNFNVNKISNELPTFTHVIDNVYCTFCYSVPFRLLDQYTLIVKEVIQVMKVRTDISLEIILPSMFREKYIVDIIGAEGIIAVDESLKLYQV
jgi:hypothetical protein